MVFPPKEPIGNMESVATAGHMLWESETSRSKMPNYGQLFRPVRLKEARTAFLAHNQNRNCKQHVRLKNFKLNISSNISSS